MPCCPRFRGPLLFFAFAEATLNSFATAQVLVRLQVQLPKHVARSEVHTLPLFFGILQVLVVQYFPHLLRRSLVWI